MEKKRKKVKKGKKRRSFISNFSSIYKIFVQLFFIIYATINIYILYNLI